MTFNSVYEITNPLTKVGKQHFIEYFTGKDLDTNRWVFQQASGTGTTGMQDAADGGYMQTTSASNSSNYMQIKAGGGSIRAFDAVGCAFIAVARAITGSNNAFYVGLHEDSYIAASHTSSKSYYELQCRNNLVGTVGVSSSLGIDYDWHTHKASTDGTAAHYWIDGLVSCTQTSTLPSTAAGDLEPWFQSYTVSGATSRSTAIRYFEAWNH